MDKRTKQLLAEEAKRFMQISEYSFIGLNEVEDEEEAAPTDTPADDKPEGGDELDQELQGLEADLDAASPEGEEGGEFGDDIPEPDADLGGDMDAPMPEPTGGDEVEVDVTDLVNTSNELKDSSDETNQKMVELIDKFNTLSSQMAKMSQISQNIETLDKKIKDVEVEIVRRNPTPTEKIEMRSLDSFPYNLKLSDFWSDNADKLANNSPEPNTQKPKEYVLTKQDAENYQDSDIRSSFNEFEEEDI